MDFFVIKTTSKKGYCCVRLCRHKLAPKCQHCGRFCRRCKDRRYALTNPVAYAFAKLRSNAHQRGIAFSLTRTEWEKFCTETQYDQKRGRNKLDLSVDREDRAKGYTFENIRARTVSENSGKDNYPPTPRSYAEEEPLF